MSSAAAADAATQAQALGPGFTTMFTDPPDAVIACWAVGTTFLLLTTGIALKRILFLRKAGKILALPRMYVKIMTGPIVYAASACAALYAPRAALLSDLARSISFSGVLSAFLESINIQLAMLSPLEPGVSAGSVMGRMNTITKYGPGSGGAAGKEAWTSRKKKKSEEKTSQGEAKDESGKKKSCCTKLYESDRVQRVLVKYGNALAKQSAFLIPAMSFLKSWVQTETASTELTNWITAATNITLISAMVSIVVIALLAKSSQKVFPGKRMKLKYGSVILFLAIISFQPWLFDILQRVEVFEPIDGTYSAYTAGLLYYNAALCVESSIVVLLMAKAFDWKLETNGNQVHPQV